MKLDNKIPSLLGVALLLVSAFGAAYLSSKPTSFSSKASGNCDPDNLQITNLTDKTVNIFFVTSSDCQSNLILGSKSYPNIRTSNPTDSQNLHYFSITGLTPGTNYNFSLVSGGKKYQLSSYLFATRAPASSNLPASNLAWGKILTENRIPASGAVIFMNIPQAAPISALSNGEGFFNVPLASAYDISGASWFQPPPNTPEEILVFYPGFPPTQVTANTDRNNPLPDIVIGQNADFGQQTAIPPQSVGNLGLGANSNPVVSDTLTIDYPKSSDSVPLSPLPEFFGKSPPNVVLTLMLDSQSYTLTPPTSNWRWSPPSALSLGSHRLTISSTITTKSVDFKVVSAASLPAFTASGSASPSLPTPTPTPLPTPQSTPIPTIIEPTPTMSLPTPTIRQTRPSTESGVPVTGIPIPMLVLLVSTAIFWGYSYRLWKK